MTHGKIDVTFKDFDDEPIRRVLSTWIDLAHKPSVSFDPETCRARSQRITRKDFKIKHHPRSLVSVTVHHNTMYIRYFNSARAARSYIKGAIAIADAYHDAIDDMSRPAGMYPIRGQLGEMTGVVVHFDAKVEFPDTLSEIDMGGICNA